MESGKKLTEPVMCVGNSEGKIIPKHKRNELGVGVNRKQLK